MIRSIEIMEFYDARDIAHRFHLQNPSRSNDRVGRGQMDQFMVSFLGEIGSVYDEP